MGMGLIGKKGGMGFMEKKIAKQRRK